LKIVPPFENGGFIGLFFESQAGEEKAETIAKNFGIAQWLIGGYNRITG